MSICLEATELILKIVFCVFLCHCTKCKSNDTAHNNAIKKKSRAINRDAYLFRSFYFITQCMVHKKLSNTFILCVWPWFIFRWRTLFLLNVEFDYGLTRNTINMGMWDDILKEKHISVWVQNLVKSFSFVLFNYTVCYFFYPQ